MIYGAFTVVITDKGKSYHHLVIIEGQYHTHLFCYTSNGKILMSRPFASILQAQLYAEEHWTLPLREWFRIPNAPEIPTQMEGLEQLSKMIARIIFCHVVRIPTSRMLSIYSQYSRVVLRSQARAFVRPFIESMQQTTSMEYVLWIYRNRLRLDLKNNDWNAAIELMIRFKGRWATEAEIRAFLEQFYEQEIAQKERTP